MVVNSQDYPDLFFARQVINNACGTQALLSILLNLKDENIKLGETLKTFIDFASPLDAEMRGWCSVNMNSSYFVSSFDSAFLIFNSF